MGIWGSSYSSRMKSPFVAGQRQRREIMLGIWKWKASFWCRGEQDIFNKGIDAKAGGFTVAGLWRRRKLYLLSEQSLQHPLSSEKLNLIYDLNKFRKQKFGFFSFCLLFSFCVVKAKNWGCEIKKWKIKKIILVFCLDSFSVNSIFWFPAQN